MICNGCLKPADPATATITPGKLKKRWCAPGTYVTKRTVLCKACLGWIAAASKRQLRRGMADIARAMRRAGMARAAIMETLKEAKRTGGVE